MTVKLKRISNDKGHTLIDANTSDPIAIVTPTSSSSYDKEVSVRWHPTFLKMNPSVGNSLLHRNLGTHKSKAEGYNRVSNSYSNILNTNEVKDPFEHEYIGPETTNNNISHVYKLKHEGVHIANLRVGDSHHKHMGSNTHYYDNVVLALQPDFAATVPEIAVKLANKKYNKDTLSSTFEKLQYLVTNSNTGGPRFVGHQKSTGANLLTYKTTLEPNVSSVEFEKHLKKTNPSIEVTRHTPSIFTARQSTAFGLNDIHHTVISTPGIISHSQATVNPTATDHTHLVESTK